VFFLQKTFPLYSGRAYKGNARERKRVSWLQFMLKLAYSCNYQRKAWSTLQVSGSDENCHKNFGCLNGESRQQRRRRQHCRRRPFGLPSSS